MGTDFFKVFYQSGETVSLHRASSLSPHGNPVNQSMQLTLSDPHA
jgi:hypothetical protein